MAPTVFSEPAAPPSPAVCLPAISSRASTRIAQLRAWLLASRPKTLGAAVVPFLVGSAIAQRRGRVAWSLVLPAFPALLLIQIATNLVNDACDFWSGADCSTRVGPRRASQSGVFSAAAVHRAGVACFALAALCVLPAVLARGWTLLCVYASSCAAGYFYTGGPWPLGYHGLGDITVVLFFGLVATAGVRFIHTGGPLFDPPTSLAGLQVGLLAATLLAVNNVRDAATDAPVGKRTLAVLLGLKGSRVEIALLVLSAYVLGLAWPALGAPRAALWPLIALPLSAALVFGVAVTPPGPAYNALLVLAAAGHAAFGALLAAALASSS